MKLLTVAVLAWALMSATSALASSDPAALAPPPSYSGLRLDRAWQPVDTSRTLGSPASWANMPIPANVAIDTRVVSPWTSRTLSDQVAYEIHQLAHAGGVNRTWVNRTAYTPEITVAPDDTPLRYVRLCYGTQPRAAGDACTQPNWLGSDAQMLAAGVPIPASITGGAPGTDSEYVVVQPSYRATAWPAGDVGRAYEFWQLHPNPAYNSAVAEGATNPSLIAAQAGRIAPLNRSPIHSQTVTCCQAGYALGDPTNPDSERQEAGWKVTGSGLPLWNDVVSSEDCALGRIDHAIGLELPDTRGYARWPASTSDGWDSSVATTEGDRVQIDPAAVEPADDTPLGHLIWQAGQTHGFVVDDQTTGGAVVVRLQLNSLQCLSLMGGRGPDQQIPWLATAPLRLLVAGSDSSPYA